MRLFRFSFGNLLWVSFIPALYVFLYVPIIILIVFSFNNAGSLYQWEGFTLYWYKQLLQSPEVIDAAQTSFIVALCASMLSIALALIWIYYSAYARLPINNTVFFTNLFVPEIIFALGLLLFFVYVHAALGVLTLIIAHTVLGLGYAVPLLHGRYQELDTTLVEASFDLKAGVHQTFRHIIIPALMPAIISAFLLIFIISLDDFLLAFLCSGSSVQTLSVYIFSMIRTGVSPTINALSTILLLMSSIIVLAASFWGVRKHVYE